MTLSRLAKLAALFTGISGSLFAGFNFQYAPETRQWTLTNGLIEAQFQLSDSGNFGMNRLRLLDSTLPSFDVWNAPQSVPSSPFRFTVDDSTIDGKSRFRLVSQYAESIEKKGYRQHIVIEDLGGLMQVHLRFEMFEGQPVLRQAIQLKNIAASTQYLRVLDMLPFAFDDVGAKYAVFRVNQWAVAPKPQNFETTSTALDPNGATTYVHAGAEAPQCAWLALRDESGRGLFAAWEFDGLADGSVRQVSSSHALQLGASLLQLYHPIEAGGQFEIPASFIGLYHGDWDEAGYKTQRFAESVLAKAPPSSTAFPYVVWDSWGYGDKIEENVLRRNADLAAALGIELFVVDLGWARGIGDWYEDPAKFPSGLRAFSDYVHSLGMKFGLHFALAEAAADSPVLKDHPDWTTSEEYHYFGAKSLCLSNAPARQWIIDQANRMIQDYNVDWILQDGENMVKTCTKTTHTHDPQDSNYMNAVEGIDAVVEAVQRSQPATSWENCEDGGAMMTFRMIQHYVTSITNDASGTLGARQAAYGATYLFPPRYVDRYMPANTLDTYTTRSFMFGGPWVFMDRLPEFSQDDLKLASSEIAAFKRIRGNVRDGKVFHITGAPAENRIDALQSYNAVTDSAVSVVTRDDSNDDNFVLKMRGLNPDANYQVTFQDDARFLVMTGRQLMDNGIALSFADPQAAQIVFVDPM